MNILIPIFLLVLGVVLVVKGGDLFVDASTWMAEVSGIPKLIVGATIVSVATTLPEMIVSVIAAAQGKVDMSIGNAVGSVTANIGLIMAIALIFMPGVIRRRDYLGKSLMMLFAALLIVVCGVLSKVNILFSIALLIIFAFFLWDNVREARRTMKADSGLQEQIEVTDRKSKKKIDKKTIVINTVKFLAGAAGIVAGANLLVNNGSELARLMGVSERIIGVTMVAIGTSLPELITTVTAIAKKQSALSLGNILGANILDLTLIMPMSALISGKSLPISSACARLDLPVCLLVGLIAVVPTLIRSKFSRWQGVLLLTVYAVYMVVTCLI